jgi:hypothetical protein
LVYDIQVIAAVLIDDLRRSPDRSTPAASRRQFVLGQAVDLFRCGLAANQMQAEWLTI